MVTLAETLRMITNWVLDLQKGAELQAWVAHRIAKGSDH